MAADEEFTGNLYRSPAELADWIAQTRETALDPALPIIDAHHHFWDDGRGRYLAPDLLADIDGGHNVRATVFVECTTQYRTELPEPLRPVGETAFASAIAEAAEAGGCRFAAAIVGFADLTLGDAVDEVLDAHVAADPRRFRGIRHAAPWDPSVGRHAYRQSPRGLMRDERFRAGFARLAARGMTFDAWLYHPQHDDLIDLATRFPDATIILNHVGGMLGVGQHAHRPSETFAEWRRGIAALARLPNVVVKLGGLGMLSFGLGFHRRPAPPTSVDLAASWRPFIETCIDAFGPRRCMFESNFPVDKQSCSYTSLWNALKSIATGYTADEKAALFGGTAASVYRIDMAEPR